MKVNYVNREISWLKFNARVLQEAADTSVPLLERIRFLGIYSNNLDEFFKVRYAKLVRAIEQGTVFSNIIENQTKEDLLIEIEAVVKTQQNRYDKLYQELMLALESESIYLIDDSHLLPQHLDFIESYFKEKLSHSIVVLNLNKKNNHQIQLQLQMMYLAVKMTKVDGPSNYALIEVPTQLFPRFVVLKSVNLKDYVIYLEDIIRYHLKTIFKTFEFDKIEAHAIRSTRDAELSLDKDVQESFLNQIAKSVEGRKEGETVRLVYDKDIAEDTLEVIKTLLNIDKFDHLAPGVKYHNKKDLMKFPNLNRRDLEYNKIKSFAPPGLQNVKSYFKVFKEKDYLLYAPYHDYSIFLKFLREAAIDPTVNKIFITIYRVSEESQVMSALMNAAKNGIEVTAVLELRARFDEANNVNWSKILQSAGVNVIFGVQELKVHSKVGMIERTENGKTQQYSFISTGNFHEGTANIYTDFTLFTAKEEINQEVAHLFDFFKANYKIKTYQYLMVSPLETRKKMYQYIDREIKNQKEGKPAQINFKVNSLADKGIIDKLYEASKSGVEVRLVVRGICSLVAQRKGLSENITAISVVDKFLEHPRMYWFKNAGDDLIYLSSGDLMTRNIDNRVELACPVLDSDLKKEISDIFDLTFKDNVKGRILTDSIADEPYQTNDQESNRSQELIYYYLNFKTANED